MHAGYADVESGDRHIAHIVDSLRNSPQWKNMVVVRLATRLFDLPVLDGLKARRGDEGARAAADGRSDQCLDVWRVMLSA